MNRRIGENMNDNPFDTGADELQKRMTSARSRPQTTQAHKSAVSLHFQEDFEDDVVSPLPPDMRNHINSRRQQSEIEEEKMRRLGKEEYNRQTYGDNLYKPQFAFNEDGGHNMDVIKLMNKKWGAGNQISHNTPLPGHLETDISFLENGAIETAFDNGVASGLGYKQPTKAESSMAANKKAKEITLAYNKNTEIPLSKTPISKIKLIIEYSEECAAEDKHCVVSLIKKSRGGNEKTVKIEIVGEGKVLTGESFMYFFEKRDDNFTELYAKLTGARVVETSLMIYN